MRILLCRHRPDARRDARSLFGDGRKWTVYESHTRSDARAIDRVVAALPRASDRFKTPRLQCQTKSGLITAFNTTAAPSSFARFDSHHTAPFLPDQGYSSPASKNDATAPSVG